jgi:hypothetical protein
MLWRWGRRDGDPRPHQGSSALAEFKRVLALSQLDARRLSYDRIAAEHLFLGLVGEGEGAAAQALVALGVDLSTVRQGVTGLFPDSCSDKAARDREANIHRLQQTARQDAESPQVNTALEAYWCTSAGVRQRCSGKGRRSPNIASGCFGGRRAAYFAASPTRRTGIPHEMATGGRRDQTIVGPKALSSGVNESGPDQECFDGRTSSPRFMTKPS